MAEHAFCATFSFTPALHTACRIVEGISMLIPFSLESRSPALDMEKKRPQTQCQGQDDEDHYDAEVDALYIQFLETTATTERLAEEIAADYDAKGQLAGIEILDAMKRFGDPKVLRQVILEDVGLGMT
jgi:uncharacterized protein YuzE